MKVIGITGGIGSGKTSVAQYLESLGFPVYNSDEQAKDIANQDTSLKAAITQLLGKEAYDASGSYNRKYVADRVFKDPQALEELNAIIHPAVEKDFAAWLERQTSEVVFKETALLFELKLHEQCYKSILVTAEEPTRIQRVMRRDGKSHDRVKQIIQLQMPEEKKRPLADFIIENNAGLEDLKQRTQSVLNAIIQI